MRREWMRLILVSGAICLADQVTKFWIINNIALHDHVSVIPGFFNINHVLNPGGAFGFFADQSPGIRKFVFLFLSSMVTVILSWFYLRVAKTHRVLSYGLAMIMGGAIGNLVDRFRYGMVVDFLDFYIGNYHWPSFNVADSAICIGMAILIYHMLFNKLPDV